MGKANSCLRNIGLFSQVSNLFSVLVKESNMDFNMEVTATFDEQRMYPLFSLYVWQKSCEELNGVVGSNANTCLLRHYDADTLGKPTVKYLMFLYCTPVLRQTEPQKPLEWGLQVFSVFILIYLLN